MTCDFSHIWIQYSYWRIIFTMKREMGDQGGRRKKNNTEPRETSERSKKENPNLHVVWLLIMLSLTTPNNERFVGYFTTSLQTVTLCVVLLRLVQWTPLPILLMPLETCLEAGMIGHGGCSFGCLEGLSHSLRTQPYSYSQDPLSLP